MDIKTGRAYEYCIWAKRKSNGKTPAYVKKQAAAWLKIADDKDREAYVNEGAYEYLCRILGLITHPDLGVNMLEGLEDYAVFLITAVFCTRSRKDESRYYQTALLEIGRKNFKTFTSAVIFIVGLLIEPKFSRFFSVAPDFKLSSELMLAVKKIIKSSPELEGYFKIKRDEVYCMLNDITYTPLAYNKDKMDGKLASIFLADEAGNLDSYPVEAMRSSQITIKNKLGIIISTQYPNDNNVMLSEIEYAKMVLDRTVKDRRYFALLYEPDEKIRGQWQTDKRCIYQSNPVTVKNKYILGELIKKRDRAILQEDKRENYLCKHNNIFYRGLGTEQYIDVEKVKLCRTDIPNDFWFGKNVFLGVDLSISTDNTAVMFVTKENGIVYCGGMCFIPGNKIDIKSEKEKLNYRAEVNKGVCTACGGDVIDYAVVEDYILELESRYGFNIMQIGYDRYNALSTVQKLERAGYECVEIIQHSRVLHSPTKLLEELILNGCFRYSENRLLEINFENAKCVKDTNLNKYINKKKTNNKIDMVAALINAVCLLEQWELNEPEFISMT